MGKIYSARKDYFWTTHVLLQSYRQTSLTQKLKDTTQHLIATHHFVDLVLAQEICHQHGNHEAIEASQTLERKDRNTRASVIAFRFYLIVHLPSCSFTAQFFVCLLKSPIVFNGAYSKKDAYGISLNCFNFVFTTVRLLVASTGTENVEQIFLDYSLIR